MGESSAAGGLPVPWLDRNGSASFDISGFVASLEAQSLPAGSSRHDLLIALRHAEYRAQSDPWTLPYHVRYAQAVLEIAVEWSMAVVERWAVAWLVAAGGSHLRLRWSSWSRNGGLRRDGRAAAPITVLASAEDRVIVGCRSGDVAIWTSDAGLTAPERLDSPVWAAAARDGRFLFAGARGYFTTRPERWRLPPLRESRLGGIAAVAISPAGFVAIGDNKGQVWICPPEGGWTGLSPPDESSVRALSFNRDATLKVVWHSGWIATSNPSVSGVWVPPGPRRLMAAGSTVAISAAAFDDSGERLAIVTAGTVCIVHGADVQVAWAHPGVQAVAWSPDGLLASSGGDALLIGEPDKPSTKPEPIRGEAVGGAVAFLGADHIVTSVGADLAQWAVREAGSDVPDAESEDVITAVATDPRNPARTIAGTRRGRLLCYDRRGSPSLLLAGLRGRVYQLAACRGEWLIAGQTGPYRWAFPAGTPARPLGKLRHQCLTVAASGRDVAFASNKEVYTLSYLFPLSFDRAVLDVRFGDDGAVGAVDEYGTIRIRDRTGAEWSVPGSPGRSGWRLVAASGRAVTVWHPGGDVLSVAWSGECRPLGKVPADADAVLKFDDRRLIVVRRDLGLGLTEMDSTWGQVVTGVSTRVKTASTDGRRIAAASGKRVLGYDLLEPAETDGGGVLALEARFSSDLCSVTLPDRTVVELSKKQLSALRLAQTEEWDELLDAARQPTLNSDLLRERGTRLAVEQQSRLVAEASVLGDQLWWAGIDLAADHARGSDPNRPLRIEWSCDEQADDIPWELVSPSAAPLGWFTDPPVTVVRSVKPRQPGASERTRIYGPLTRHTMLVIRGAQDELRTSDRAYAWTQRRTRRSNLSLPRPTIIRVSDDLAMALPDAVDILQLWAHCGPTGVRFSDRAQFKTAELADVLARCAPRLAVLVGCRSGALGRALVERGVEAVVAMRVEVYSQTVQPLVADLVSLVLDGMPVDLAFAEALRGYVLTGQPGAAAVPLLYLAEGSTGRLFPHSSPAPSHLQDASPEESS